MTHIPDGVLRRLDDEPLAVPDRVTDHLAGCGRCSARRAEISRDTERAAQLLSGPQPVPDIDVAWSRLQREVRWNRDEGAGRRRRPRPIRRRFPRVSVRAGMVMGALAIIVGGTAAAATLTDAFAPTHVAPVSVSRTDLREVASLMGLGDSQTLGGFPTPNGSRRLGFGAIRWSSARSARAVPSLAQASADAGFPVPLAVHLPAGVGAVQQLVVQPRVSATVSFNSTAGPLAGSSASIHVGPAVLAEYAGASATDMPALGVATMPRPTALSTGASIGQIEAFLLARPGIPPDLAEEIRLLGDLRTTLPVPVPAGASVRSVQIGGWPGVLLADASKAAAAVIWEDGKSMLHIVAGILDPQDVLNVANQLG